MSGDGRLSRRRVITAGAAGVVLAACGGTRRRPKAPSGPGPPGGPGHPLIVGVVAPLSGPYAAVGQTAVAGLTAATLHIQIDLGDSFLGYRPTIVTADAPLTAVQGQQAYAQLKAKGVDALLWCGAPGLAETVPAIVADLMPVIAVGTDLQGRAATDSAVPDLTSADAAGFPVFQLTVPIASALDALAAYAAGDRGFQRAAVVWSSSAAPGAPAVFAAACAKHRLAVVGAPGFDSSGGPPDLSGTAKALRATGAELVVVVGEAPDAAALVTQLDALGARYVDTPTTRSGGFRPMIAGIAAATGTATFPRLAGAHAAKGTIAAATLSAASGLPQFPIRDWLTRHSPGYGVPRGGEEEAADALALLLAAAGASRSTAGADLVAALEGTTGLAFATPLPVGFAATRHVAPTTGDLALLTLESSPELRYNLGQEWRTVYRAGDHLPDLLVDPTLAANRAAYPGLMASILTQRFGISAQSSYQQGDVAKMAACRAIH